MEILEQKMMYRIGEQISEGGTGIIYTAEKLNSEGNPDGIRYAVKELGEKFGNIAKKEKYISQKIENESKYSVVIPVLDAVHANQKEYLVMQLKRHGMFLNEMIDEIKNEITQKSAFPFIHLKGILSAVLYALKRLHHCLPDNSGRMGFLNLDLHPGNIFMENADWRNHIYGTVKFIDLQNSIELMSDGSVYTGFEKQLLGVTRGFCAPELAERNFEKISIQTDLYSATAICLYMMTGEYRDNPSYFSSGYPIYDIDEINEILQKMDLVPAACIQIRILLEKGLSNHVMNRFQDAEEMLECLDNAWKFQELYDSGDYYDLYQLVYHAKLEKYHFQESSGYISEKGFCNSVKKLASKLRQDQYSVSECRYIFQRLYSLYMEHSDIAGAKILAEFYSSGLAIYNHLADKKKCVEISDRLLELKKELHVMEWASIVNRMSVYYADVFQTDKAMCIVKDNIENLEKIKEAYLSMALKEGMSSSSAMLIDLGRSYSAYGTYLAYERIGNPMEYFEKALCEFCPGKGNDDITISHILHYAVYGEYSLFDKWYRKMTGGKTLEEQDEIGVFLNSDNNRKNCFHLWIYVKAVYLYDMQHNIKNLKKRIIELLNHRDLYLQDQHPAALILKYCGLLLYRLDKESCRLYADNAFKKAIRKLENKVRKEQGELTLFKIMAYHIESEAMIVSGKEDYAEKLYIEFKERLEHSIFYKLNNWLEEYNKNRKIPKIMLKGEYC